MKKVLQIVAAVVFMAAVSGAGEAVNAASCAVGSTGPNSNNLCETVETRTCTRFVENTIYINDTSFPVSSTGDAIVDGNGSATTATTGNAENSNQNIISVTINNGEGEDSNCTFKVVTTTPATPDVPAVVTPAATTPPQVKVLPKTNGTSPALFAGATVAVLLGAVVASRFGLAAYGKLKG